MLEYRDAMVDTKPASWCCDPESRVTIMMTYTEENSTSNLFDILIARSGSSVSLLPLLCNVSGTDGSLDCGMVSNSAPIVCTISVLRGERFLRFCKATLQYCITKGCIVGIEAAMMTTLISFLFRPKSLASVPGGHRRDLHCPDGIACSIP